MKPIIVLSIDTEYKGASFPCLEAPLAEADGIDPELQGELLANLLYNDADINFWNGLSRRIMELEKQSAFQNLDGN